MLWGLVSYRWKKREPSDGEVTIRRVKEFGGE